jgi:hypothetical protein
VDKIELTSEADRRDLFILVSRSSLFFPAIVQKREIAVVGSQIHTPGARRICSEFLQLCVDARNKESLVFFVVAYVALNSKGYVENS